jgi:RimJ/RimL family protein N-acetyltransferase
MSPGAPSEVTVVGSFSPLETMWRQNSVQQASGSLLPTARWSRCFLPSEPVYVHPNATGQGIGLLLLKALISSTEAAGIWTIQCGIFPENLASLAVHRRAGFRDVGTRHRLGHMPYGPLAGQWRDVILLERRSSVAGTTPSR